MSAARERFALVHEHLADGNPDGQIGIIAVFRRRGGGVWEVGSFLVDTGCLGVKDAAHYQVDKDDLESFRKRIFPESAAPLEKPVAWARKFIEDAIAYARQFGFAPARDYKKAARVFGGVNVQDCSETFAFGRTGKPFYVQGPHDSDAKAQRIVTALERKCGPDGFHYMVGGYPGEDFDDAESLLDQQIDEFLEKAEEGYHDLAERGLRKLLREHPEAAFLQYAVGTVLALRGNPTEALPFLEKAVELDPMLSQAWTNLSVAYGQREQFGFMIRALRKCVETAETSNEHYEKAKRTLNGMKETAAAEGYQSFDDFATAAFLFDEGMVFMRQQHWANALTRFESFLEINSRTPSAWGNAGSCLARLGRYVEARRHLEKALEIKPDYEPALINLDTLNALESMSPEERKRSDETTLQVEVRS